MWAMEGDRNRQCRRYPLFSACGLNCGLCPRYYTEGESRCPGCGGEDFSLKHPSCGILSCCRRHGQQYCGLCEQYPCNRYEGACLYDSFITHKNQLIDLGKAKEYGLDAYEAELDQKVALLKILLADYDDGRKKSFFCLAVNLLDLQDILSVMGQIADHLGAGDSKKEKAAMAERLFQRAAESRNIPLKLRKKPTL